MNDPFQQWRLDFIGEINPSSSGHHKWILVDTYYFTKWIEVVPTRVSTHQVIMNFLYENIFIRFGFPVRLVTNNAPAFKRVQWGNGLCLMITPKRPPLGLGKRNCVEIAISNV